LLPPSPPRLPLRFLNPVPVPSDSKPSSPNPLYNSFLNLPNFISFSRLLSGPLLGWYGYLRFTFWFFFFKKILCWFHFAFSNFVQDDHERVVYFGNDRVGPLWCDWLGIYNCINADIYYCYKIMLNLALLIFIFLWCK
jgi:hypothetical protein